MRDRPKQQRWRPRFSIRMILVLVAIVCAYAACWWPTKNQGIADVDRFIGDPAGWPSTTVAPLIISRESQDDRGDTRVVLSRRDGNYSTTELEIDVVHRYYFWCFGYVATLPFEREGAETIVAVFSEAP